MHAKSRHKAALRAAAGSTPALLALDAELVVLDDDSVGVDGDVCDLSHDEIAPDPRPIS